jgi:class 3 adenylate cyclase
MPLTKLRIKHRKQKLGGKFLHRHEISLSELSKFTPKLLGLDEVGMKRKSVSAIAVVFDLEGFTDFCSQTEAEPAIPTFLHPFLKWIFKEISDRALAEHPRERGIVRISYPLPFFVKFLGDGFLLLWNAEIISEVQQGNLIVDIRSITDKYKWDFLQSMRSRVNRVPTRLRAGIARGRVVPIGRSDDFVGPCINIASRLQKLNGLTFAVWQNGLHLNFPWLTTKRIPLRGVSKGELVYVVEEELKRLPAKKRNQFKKP